MEVKYVSHVTKIVTAAQDQWIISDMVVATNALVLSVRILIYLYKNEQKIKLFLLKKFEMMMNIQL